MVPRFPRWEHSLLGDSVVALINVATYVDHYRSFLNTCQFLGMHQDGDELDFVEARFDKKHDVGPETL